MFASQGLDAPRLLCAAGIDGAVLRDPDARVEVEKISRLWEVAVAWSGKPALGMDRELPARHVNFDAIGYVMLASPSLKAGLMSLARYYAVISDAITLELEPEGDNCWLVLGLIGNARPLPRQRLEYSLLTVASLCRWITRREVQALAVEFVDPEPLEAEPYLRAFGCPVRFGQPRNRLLLTRADLDMPLLSRDPVLFDMHQRVIEARLVRLGSSSTAHRVSEEILRRLHLGEPRREDVASSLAMADRTLQRRLHEENTSFQQLLDGARRDLAQKYLAESRHTLGQVADLLGFADQSNFFRANKRWFGVSPGQYRSRLQEEQPLDVHS
ncbi:AraC family transcriptional regulator [Hydrogenophaga sp. BPS33]|uniref:AraC family transcriptional regulator n=1 Tax=Hydrogenophaga sp. BPS33 TaxID=2651974 RepID=UPI0013203076|nr:AraC family transcriptional regulator [Hydrogenophaga sp. BPS33]QHE86041.1 AraC family transcriptional regulator [Hydrogenophaga sp. BPS33]